MLLDKPCSFPGLFFASPATGVISFRNVSREILTSKVSRRRRRDSKRKMRQKDEGEERGREGEGEKEREREREQLTTF